MTEHEKEPLEHLTDRPAQRLPKPQPAKRRPARSMHEDVPVWYDCCSCQAEPYWLESAGEPGNAPGGGREETAPEDVSPPADP
jgi:hypothetical protein